MSRYWHADQEGHGDARAGVPFTSFNTRPPTRLVRRLRRLLRSRRWSRRNDRHRPHARLLAGVPSQCTWACGSGLFAGEQRRGRPPARHQAADLVCVAQVISPHLVQGNMAMSVDGVQVRLISGGTSLARADRGEWLGTPIEDQRVARVEYDIVAWGADECTIRAPDGQWGDALLGQVQLIQAPVGHPATWADPQLAYGIAIRQAQ